MVEAELDAFISRRAHQNRAEREREEMYAESVRRYQERCRRQLQAEWYDYFCRLAEGLRRRADEYDERAETLLERPGEGEGNR
jgi:hypothetical protein